MKPIFADDFENHADGEYPDGLRVESHADPFHALGVVRDKAYQIEFPGNKHILLTPRLGRFILSIGCRGDAYSDYIALLIFFHYQPETRSGYCLRHQWSREGLNTVFGIYRKGDYETLQVVTTADRGIEVADEQQLRLEARDNEVVFHHNEKLVGRFQNSVGPFRTAGLIAFDRSGRKHSYAMALTHIRVESDEPVSSAPLFPSLDIEFPMNPNGMTVPYRFQAQARAEEGRVMLNVRLTGGPTERPPSVCDYRGQRANTTLWDPYVRVEGPQGTVWGPYRLVCGSVGLKAHWDPMSSGFLPADTECPVAADFVLSNWPEGAVICFGYAHYAAEDRLPLQGGPTEMIVEPQSGRILYTGPALPRGVLTLELRSPADKKIRKALSRQDPRYAQAVVFAENNHYFFESEPCRFALVIRHRRDELRRLPMTVRFQLETVFHEPRGEPIVADMPWTALPSVDDGVACLGVETRLTDPVTLPSLAVGVYHLRAELRLGDSLVGVERRAFEVMADDPAAPAPPQAAGLPELIPFLPDYASEAAGFEPWVGVGVDAEHYLSHTCFHPLVARAGRIWEAVHLYRRKWVLELSPRMLPDSRLETNLDLVAQCDLLNMYDRKDLWKQEIYADETVRDVLVRFLSSADFQPETGSRLSAEAARAERALSDEQFAELIGRHWKLWLQFYNRIHAEELLSRLRARLTEVNPRAQLMSYDIFPPYAAAYKSAYAPLYAGHDLRNGLERFWDGPLIYEDYPYICGYPMQRSVFTLASWKLEAPRLRHYPEVYGVNGCAGDSRLRFGSPSYASSRPPLGYFRKIFFEYAFAAVWFAGDGFHYWNDDGFQAMCWTRAHYEEFLAAWAVIVRHRPRRPLRVTGFVYSRTACLNHPDDYRSCRYNEDFEPGIYRFGDMVNTAEEAVPFAYEQARRDGQPAGFVIRLEDLDALAPADVDTLVLPPLTGVKAVALDAIRRKHEQGVNLLAFEDVTGLEDLFGVRPMADSIRYAAIQANARLPEDADWPALATLRECCESDRCRSRYRTAGATVILDGLDETGQVTGPALVIQRTRWGRTALFTIPPTSVYRQTMKYLVFYGKESLSEPINRATAMTLRWLGRPQAETTAGKLIAFRDQHGHVQVIVEEDAYPGKPKPIDPIVTVRLPGLHPADITCDKALAVVECQPALARVRLHLEAHECARIQIDEGRMPT